MRRIDVYGFGLALFFFLPAFSHTQESSDKPQAISPQSSTPASANTEEKAPEIISQERAATFHVNVKLVVAKVVVRDHQGHAVGNLHKEDFQIVDNGKPQEITEFSVEQPGTQIAREKQSLASPPATIAPTGTSEPNVPSAPERYVVYLFDDIHLKFEDVARTREAAERSIAALPSTVRFAIYSTSGRTMLDFTDDKSQASATLKTLQTRPMMLGNEGIRCPDLTVYLADLIVNQHNPEAMATAISEVRTPPACYSGPDATGFITGAALQVLAIGQQESQAAIGAVKNIVRRLAIMPGSRNIVLVSPGFLIPGLQYDLNEVIETALRAQVIVGALDARGVYVTPGVITDTSKGFGAGTQAVDPGSIVTPMSRPILDQQAADRQKDVMADLSYSTGGKFFFNNNDLDEGFRRLAEPPEYVYVLGFAPQNLKPDGSYHKLKVKLRSGEKLDLQARKGYFAPKSFADPAQQAKEEVKQLEFSPDELHDLPVELHTQFYTASLNNAKLSVLAHVDVKRLAFKKVEDRNCDVLTVASLVFDRNGNFLQGTEKELDLRLTNDTLEHKMASGMTVKSSFEVQPGNYLVRIVVRDEQSNLMSAENANVEIWDTPLPTVTPSSPSSQGQPLDNQSRPEPLTSNQEAEINPWAKAKPYIDDPLPKLEKTIPELKGLTPAAEEAKLNSILASTGEKCADLLRRTPNLISREEVVTILPLVGIQRQNFEYLLISHQTENNDTELREYRTVNGRLADNHDLSFGPAFSQGFISEWLRLYPANQSESRFRYLGEQIVDKHETFVLAFTQIPGSVRFPARFQAEGRSAPILFQGIIWIDSADFRIVRMREDLLAPRPDVHLYAFTTRIHFGDVHIPEANLDLWLPQEVDIDWYFRARNVHRSHKYSKYRMYTATTKIVPTP
jgi:VWFA-related protein